jgi:simple sugar transport system ATP-binding protein
VTPLVRIEDVTKRFGGVLANASVSFDIASGRVLALLGENGAGKTTIMNVLAGLYLPDTGHIEIEGRRLALGSPRASVAAGVGMVHQQFRLVDTLTAFENVSLAIDRGRRLQPEQPDSRLSAIMDELGFDIDLDQPVWEMPLARRQQLEILRVLAAGASILVLDEPTAVLSPVEARGLFQIVRRIVASGRSVALITHKLNEVLEVADDIVVMRGGRVVHVGLAAESDPDKLARLIVGEREIRDSARPNAAIGDTVLAVDSVTVNDHRGVTAVRNASFVIRAGELVVIAGVTGNGQTELIEAIGGIRPLASGAITAPRISGRRAFAYIPAQSLGTGLAPDLSVRDNAILGRQRYPPFGRWLPRKAVNARSREVLARFGVEADGRVPVRHLSGGNLQRVVLGRELLAAPSLILADYPTRGLDVAAAAQIKAALIDSAQSGAAVLMSSEELEESLGIATRILVMHRGEIITDLPAADAHVDTIGRLMTWGRR